MSEDVTVKGITRRIIGTMGKAIFKPFIKGYKDMGKALSDKDMKKSTKMLRQAGAGLKGMAGFITGPLGTIMGILDKIGIAQPFMEIFNAIIEIIGAAAIQPLLPILEQLMDILMSEEVTGFLTTIGTMIGTVLNVALGIFCDVLEQLKPVFVALNPLIETLGGFIGTLATLLLLPLQLFGNLIQTLDEMGILEPILTAVTVGIGLIATGFEWLVNGQTLDEMGILEPILTAVTVGIGLIATGFEWLVNGVIDIINGVMNFLTWGLWKDIPHVGGSKEDDSIENTSVPHYIGTTTVTGGHRVRAQHGGIFERRTDVTVGEAGPEAIIPLNGSNPLGGDIYIRIDGNVYDKNIIDQVIKEIEIRRGLGII